MNEICRCVLMEIKPENVMETLGIRKAKTNKRTEFVVIRYHVEGARLYQDTYKGIKNNKEKQKNKTFDALQLLCCLLHTVHNVQTNLYKSYVGHDHYPPKSMFFERELS